MERHFALPVTFAAVAHAALLFGFSKSPRPAAIGPEFVGDYFGFVLEADPTPPELNEDSAGPREQTLDVVVPIDRSAEPPPIDPGTLPTIEVPVFPPAVGGIATTITLDPPGAGTGTGSGPGGGVIPTHLLDNSPRTRLQASPVYPFEGKQQGLRGEVLVEFVVDEQGRVLEPRVVSSSHRMFEGPTLRAVAKWVFEPGRRDGRIVRFRMSVPVQFTLND